jgi:N6-adenosine-specific RNA methylase IME4
MTKIAFHPLANIFPMIEGDAFDALVADIKANGQNEPIVLLDEKILDGRNRYRACVAADVEPAFVPFKDKDPKGKGPVAFVISANVKRRHLKESQRAMAAAELETFRHGDNQHTGGDANLHVLRPAAAKLLAVSERSVANAASVRDHGTPELAAAVKRGKLAVSAAAALVDAPPEVQRAVVTKVEAGAKVTEALRQIKKEGLADRVAALPAGKYRVIYADPPWQYNDSRVGLDMASTAAEHHYPTMPLEELKALDVKSLAADDAVLLCWATFPLLEDALELVEAWGFKYKTAFVWHKVRPNFSHYHRAEVELLMVCTRGSCTPDADERESQIFRFERGEHSRKPEEVRAMIDRQWAHGPRIELFRRGEAPAGWHVWGNEAEQYDRLERAA